MFVKSLNNVYLKKDNVHKVTAYLYIYIIIINLTKYYLI